MLGYADLLSHRHIHLLRCMRAASSPGILQILTFRLFSLKSLIPPSQHLQISKRYLRLHWRGNGLHRRRLLRHSLHGWLQWLPEHSIVQCAGWDMDLHWHLHW